MARLMAVPKSPAQALRSTRLLLVIAAELGRALSGPLAPPLGAAAGLAPVRLPPAAQPLLLEAVAQLASDLGAKQAETRPCACFAYLSVGPGGDPPLGVD